ncbi:amino acid transporter [Desarmillaria tabescens]|uniref:Amino acid transporter n=1 Tax=Armillaria tabescens TaxID=1929756 RepID=A0AA39MY48_ARMTA|nr:amino acid transporter [Desarmillaria tabescens]KAK0450364.1 amino acid transporter [Desarmillaria tabescens]
MANDVDATAVADLHKLGYQQEMTRRRGLFHILFTIMAVPYGLSAPFATGLIGGGPAVLIWGWVFVSAFIFTLALSMAEISAKYPTSGGAYYWCFRLASPRSRVPLSWINGWLTMVGVWTICLSVTFGTAQIIVAGADLIFLGVTLICTALGIFLNDILHYIDIVCACWTILGVLVMLVCLSAKAAAGRHSAAFALGHFDPSASGWTPGWSFFIGLLPISVASMAEELHNPTVDLPRAMVWSIPLGFLQGVFFLLPILFTLPDITTLLSVASGQPIGVMFTLIMGSKGGGFGMLVFGIAMFCAVSISSAASRATWAFARDKAIPLHAFFARVSSEKHGPVNAFLLVTVVQLLLGLIYLGSSAAFNAFVGVAVMCLQASYSMPVLISLVNGRDNVKDSPYSLGRWGWAINSIAVLWTMFEMVLFSMPAVVPVTRVSMNYASVVFVGFATISAVWYMISRFVLRVRVTAYHLCLDGRFYYTGPPIPSESTQPSTESVVANEKKGGTLED